MSFSSLLPSPKHEIKSTENVHETSKTMMKALTDDKDEVVQTQKSEADSIKNSFNNIASRVQLYDFIPLRQKNFDLEIPYPSTEDIDRTYKRTYEYFQSLLDKNIKRPVSNAVNETITVGNGRKIHVVTKVHDPLQPKMIRSAKKGLCPI